MIYAKRDITIPKGKRLIIVPVGDIQTEAEYPRLKGLVGWLKNKKDEGHQVYVFGMGDYFESPSPSDRAAIRAAKRGFGFYEELAKDIEKVYVTRTGRMADIFQPVAKDIGGFLKGHHWLDLISPELPKDTNQLLAQLLKTEYWGTSVLITLTINKLPFEIFASHGYGSARTPGARVAKRLRMRESYLTANWYCMGHDNDKMVYPTEALRGRDYLKQYFSGTGSFQRAYNFDEPEGTYAEELLLPPSALGVVMCNIEIQKGEDGHERLDYHVST